jgi:ribosomal protein S18 acetylase RimI-like enzyme
MDTIDLNVLLRPLRLEHLLAAAQMAASTGGRDAGDLIKMYERDLARTDRVAQVGAFVQDELVGFGRIVWVEFEALQADQVPNGWYLLGVNVLPTHRRRGIATLLTNWRIDWLAESARQLFYVAIPTNVASIRLHEALGFVKVRDHVFMPPDLDGLTLFSRGDP